MCFLTDIDRNLARIGEGRILTQLRGDRRQDTSANALRSLIRRALTFLARAGVQAGDRVALIADNSARWVAADLAILAAGAISVPLYSRLSVRQLAAVIDQPPALLVTQPVAVGMARDLRQQGLAQEPDGVGGSEFAVVLAASQLRAVEVGPAVEDPCRQLQQHQQLDLDLVQATDLILRLDIDHAQLVVEKLPLVVGVEDRDLHHWRGKLCAKHGVEEMHQQALIGFGPEQGL